MSTGAPSISRRIDNPFLLTQQKKNLPQALGGLLPKFYYCLLDGFDVLDQLGHRCLTVTI